MLGPVVDAHDDGGVCQPTSAAPTLIDGVWDVDPLDCADPLSGLHGLCVSQGESWCRTLRPRHLCGPPWEPAQRWPEGAEFVVRTAVLDAFVARAPTVRADGDGGLDPRERATLLTLLAVALQWAGLSLKAGGDDAAAAVSRAGADTDTATGPLAGLSLTQRGSYKAAQVLEAAVRELGAEVSLSPGTIQRHLKRIPAVLYRPHPRNKSLP